MRSNEQPYAISSSLMLYLSFTNRSLQVAYFIKHLLYVKNSHLCLFCLLEEHFESNLILKQYNENFIKSPELYKSAHSV